jgi:hypothetical protein
MMNTLTVTPRTRRTYDHRLREQVIRSGARCLPKHVAIPRSTVSTWTRRGLRPVVSIEPLEQDRQQLLDSLAKLDRRARVLAAVVRLLLALLRASGFSLAGKRLPDGAAKAGILRANGRQRWGTSPQGQRSKATRYRRQYRARNSVGCWSRSRAKRAAPRTRAQRRGRPPECSLRVKNG